MKNPFLSYDGSSFCPVVVYTVTLLLAGFAWYGQISTCRVATRERSASHEQ
jgi:hypothetical protein